MIEYPFPARNVSVHGQDRQPGQKDVGQQARAATPWYGRYGCPDHSKNVWFAFTYQWLQVVGYKNAEVKNSTMGRQVGTVPGMRRYPDGWHGELQMYPWTVSTGIKLMPKTKNHCFQWVQNLWRRGGDSNSRYLLSTHDFQSCFTELNITRLLRHNGLTLEYITYFSAYYTKQIFALTAMAHLTIW